MNGAPPGPRPAPIEVTPDRIAQHLATGRRTNFTALPLEREAPNAGRIARRRQLVRLSKWVMPVSAIALLGSVALWPELDRSTRIGRAAFEDAAALRASSGDMTNARYRGLDTHGRPYTITALSARQVGPDRVDLVQPQADLLDGRAWLMVTADNGVYAPRNHMLDLSGHVVLYRNDGTFMTGPTSTIDLHQSVDQSNDWIHIEGPMGTLDAQRYLMASHEGIAQFGGPARLVINSGRTP